MPRRPAWFTFDVFCILVVIPIPSSVHGGVRLRDQAGDVPTGPVRREEKKLVGRRTEPR
jgi:hypothetical protein